VKTSVVLTAVLFFLPATAAGVPSNINGFFPGQSVEDALKTKPGLAVSACDYKTVTRCINQTIELFGYSGYLDAQIDGTGHIIKVLAKANSDNQPTPVDCEAMSASIVANLEKSIGPHSSVEDDTVYHWSDARLDLSTTSICIAGSGIAVISLDPARK
jgi:hypothetical protein